MSEKNEINAEIAFGEAYGASLLLAVLLKRLGEKNILLPGEAADLIDQTLLATEKMRGRPGMPIHSIDRARAMLEATLKALSATHQKPGSPD